MPQQNEKSQQKNLGARIGTGDLLVQKVLKSQKEKS